MFLFYTVFYFYVRLWLLIIVNETVIHKYYMYVDNIIDPNFKQSQSSLQIPNTLGLKLFYHP